MRYSQGGGLTAERRELRELVRLQVAAGFARGENNAVIARGLRVSVRSVQRWRRAWSAEGRDGLRSQGPASLPLLSEEQFAVLECELAKGPAEHGWSDQKWTLPRIKTVIGRRFDISYTAKGVSVLPHRHGWSWQVPARRAVERDDAAVAVWVKDVWPQVKTPRGHSGPGSSSKTRPGSRVAPPAARTWAPRGRTPIVRVRGRTTRRVSIAALTCYLPGQRSRVIWRPYRHDRSRSDRKSFAWTDYRDLLIAAHHQLGAPIVVVWDNVNSHLTDGMRRFIAGHDWLSVYQLPAYAPDLNPVEGIWSLLRRGRLANRIITDSDDLLQIIRGDLHRVQYRPHLVDGCLTATGLTLERS
ncbi:IS630 family transposase [Nocardia pseudobrasiliensis]|uniref:Transposase n=1 Tax=Nocardia pseudobrasiliensis TaxID=45979 RepID=A0A370HKK1_9NOCA|nr:IS630 family transposase [Nocardia pseudobrasiliensis]RDI58967.1 transposase [Nocardia pseudobrasiliensis]